MKKILLLNTTNIFTLTFRSLSETFIRRSLFNSSSGSCNDRPSDATWQEIGRTCGSACSSPRPGSRTAVLFPNMYCLFDPSSTFVLNAYSPVVRLYGTEVMHKNSVVRTLLLSCVHALPSPCSMQSSSRQSYLAVLIVSICE